MQDKIKVILHIVFDDVLFDGYSNRFDKMDGYKNIYLFNGYGKNEQFRLIKDVEKVTIAKNREEWIQTLSNPETDIIYMHGLWNESFEIINFIPKDTILIWFCYGMEIYENMWGRAPLIQMKIFKKKTLIYKFKNMRNWRHMFSYSIEYFFPKLYNILKLVIDSKEHCKNIKNMLKRIDYIYTPLPIEYDILKDRCKYLHAKPFRIYPSSSLKEGPCFHPHCGAIIIDHSANLSNNHLDILHELGKRELTSRKIFIPLSYGNENVKEKVKQSLELFGSETVYLEEVLPFLDYYNIIKSCTHAIYGAIRQSGLGNINLCLRTGVKVFLYKDSIIYKQLKSIGYYIYSIEQDLNDKEIVTPLSDKEVCHNYNLFNNQREPNHGTLVQQFDRLLMSHKKSK